MGLTPTREGGWTLRLAYGAIAAIAASFSFKRLFDPDGFWMLAAGREILSSGLPRVNTLSHTYPDHPWKFTQWLSAVVLALAERAGGIAGVQVLLLLCAAALFLAITHTARRNREDFRWWAFVPFLAAAIAGSQYRITPRGDLATLLGLAAVPLLWSTRSRRLYLFAAALGALWSNLHAGVIFGLIEWGLIAAARLLRRDRDGLKAAAAALGAFFVGSLANPNGFYPYVYVLANTNALREYPLPIAEITSPSLQTHPLFWAVAILSLPALAPAWRRRDYAHLLFFLFFGALAAKALRFIPYFLVVTLPGTANHTSALARLLGERITTRIVGWVACALGFGVLGWCIFLETRGTVREHLPGWGVAPDLFPEGGCRYIERRNLPGRIFNEFDHGGYVAWRLHPGRGVFIDGRMFAYPWSFFLESLAYRVPDTRRLVDTYRADVAVVQRRPRGGDIDLGVIFEQMGWQLVYLEGTSYVFVRPGSAAGKAAEADVFRLVKPWKGWDQLLRDASAEPGRAIAELSRIETERLIQENDHHVLGAAAFLAGSPALAERFLAAGLARHPGHLSMRLDHATTLKRLGRPAESRAELERIVKMAPESEEAVSAREELRWPLHAP